MKNITRHTGKLSVIKRLKSSVNGNPRYLLEVDGYRFSTTPDSMHAYGVTNYDGKNLVVTIGSHYGVLSLNTIEGAK